VIFLGLAVCGRLMNLDGMQLLVFGGLMKRNASIPAFRSKQASKRSWQRGWGLLSCVCLLRSSSPRNRRKWQSPSPVPGRRPPLLLLFENRRALTCE
jgi:hypothetical protein